jgi:predicted GNAT superfamily acetyltransferase
MIAVRPLSTLLEFADCVHLQRLVWGWEDLDLLPVRFFVVAREIGGQVLGAFEDGFLCGFCLAIPGVRRDGSVYLHSHMLGVLPEFRNAGVGLMLKHAQREDALARDIQFVEWTFDPLELKNAYFNIQKLGVVVRRYLPNHYGITTSRLQAGMPTDRCVAEWKLTETREPRPIVATIPVPTDIDQLKQTHPHLAREVQRQVGLFFDEHFAQGLVVTGFERTDAVCYYLLSWPSD